MKLLDLFCGAGGAAVGYHRAGFDEIVGVDLKTQPRYPFAFVQGDALEYLAAHGHEFDAIHASPPCQAYSRATAWTGDRSSHPDLIAATQSAARAAVKPYVIENVQEARRLLRLPVMLCGTSLGLRVQRHRYFEMQPPLVILVPPCQHGPADYSHDHGTKQAVHEAREAIPPVYTEFIGRHLMAALTEGGKTSRVPRSPIAPSARYVEGMVRDGARGANGGAK
jgi:hypothetical protein